MRGVIVLLLFVLPVSVMGQGRDASPLARYAPAYEQAKYKACNTAANAAYMSPAEKEIIYILNLARMNPKLFCEMVVKPYCADGFVDVTSERHYKSLIKQMNKMQALGIL